MVITEEQYFKKHNINYIGLRLEAESEDFSFKSEEAYPYGNGFLVYGRCLTGCLGKDDNVMYFKESYQDPVEVVQIFPKHISRENVIRKALYKDEKAFLFVKPINIKEKLEASTLTNQLLKKAEYAC